MEERKRRSSSRQSRSTGSARGARNNSANTDNNNQRKKRKKKPFYMDKRRRMLAILAAVIVLILACIIGFATRRNGSEVLVNGESAGVINTRKITETDITNNVTALIAEQVGTNVQIMDDIKLKGVHVSAKTQAVAPEAMFTKLRDMVAYNIEAYAIAVNGNVIVTLPNQEAANTVLQYLNDKYTPEGVENVSVSYSEDVQIVTQFVDTSTVMTVEAAENKITAGETVTATHTVKSGEYLQYIASSYGMTLQEVYELNPKLNSTPNIYVGEELTVRQTKPLINVKATVTTTETETIPKETEYQYDNTKSKSYRKVVQQGSDGTQQVTKETVYINGTLDSENNVSSSTVKEAVKEIVMIGTN